MVNYAVSFFLQKIDELRLCLDVVLRNKTPVNHTPSGMLTICLYTDPWLLLIKAAVLLIVTVAAFDSFLFKTQKFLPSNSSS